MSSTSGDHVESTLSTSESEVPIQKGKFKFPCKLCEGDHVIYHCPFLYEAKIVLDDRPISLLRLPPGYKKLLPSSSLVENPDDTHLWTAEASIIEDKPYESTPNEIQKVEAAIDPVFPSEDPSLDDTITEENKDDTVQILFVNTNSDEHGGSISVPLFQEGSSLESYSAIYLVPPPSNLVVSFDWNLLSRPRLLASVPFRMIAEIYRMVMASTIIDEGASVSILSSTTWKVLGSPSLLPERRNLTGFDKRTSRP